MEREELTFNLTSKLSKFLDKNYFSKVRDFDSNLTVNYILSNNLKKFNPTLNHTFNIFFNENDIKIFKIEFDKIYFEIGKFKFNLYFVDQENFKSKKEYMDYNMGLLLNNILLNYNFKYNNEGLFYVYNKGNVYNELKITKIQEKIFELLCIDYNKYKQGFKNENEMFDFILGSPYFNSIKIITNNKIKNKIFTQFKNYLKTNKVNIINDVSVSIFYDHANEILKCDTLIKNFIKESNKTFIEIYG